MAALSCCAVANHVFITIFTAYQCKVYRVVARKVHPLLLRVGKNYACTTKCPEVPYNETPMGIHFHVAHQYSGMLHVYRLLATMTEIGYPTEKLEVCKTNSSQWFRVDPP